MKKKICFIATGGTIASRETEHGLMPAVDGAGLVAGVPELSAWCQIDFVQLLQLDSSNLVPAHWQQMAEAVGERYSAYDGFVISHGTDTMAYSAAALHYMLEGLGKPVVLTGSQLPMGVENSDAPGNLRTAFLTAISGRPGVYLAFDGRVIAGNRARKSYSQDFHGFDSINAPEAGRLAEDGQAIVWNQQAAEGDSASSPNGAQGRAGEAAKNSPLRLNTAMDSRVAVLKLVPGTNPDIIRLFADNGYRGLILEAFGAGGIPTDESPLSLLPAIDYALAKGMVVVCTTQCVHNGVHMDTYEVGVRALEHGVLSGGDATTEALTVRLMLDLGRK